MTNNIENLGTFATKDQFTAIINGGTQSSLPVGQQNPLEINSINGGLENKIKLDHNGINIQLPSNDGSHEITFLNSALNKLLNVKSGPVGNTTSCSLGVGTSSINPAVSSVALGAASGFSNQGDYSISIGGQAGNAFQGEYAISIGLNAGAQLQGDKSISIGESAGQVSQGEASVSIGNQTGRFNQSINNVAIAYSANSAQGINSTAIGHATSLLNQGTNSTAIGPQAGSGIGNNATTIGRSAGQVGTNNDVVCIGYNSCIGTTVGPVITQGIGSTSIGPQTEHHGTHGISLGYKGGTKVPALTKNNTFFIGMDGYDTGTDKSCMKKEENVSSDFRPLVLNATNHKGEIKFIHGITAAANLADTDVKQLLINTTTGQLGYLL